MKNRVFIKTEHMKRVKKIPWENWKA